LAAKLEEGKRPLGRSRRRWNDDDDDDNNNNNNNRMDLREIGLKRAE